MKLQLCDLVFNYDDKNFIPKDVMGDEDCFCRSLVLSDLIPYNNFKTFRTELSNRTMSLLKNSESLVGCQIRNYFSNNECCCGVKIDDYIVSIICENGKWAPTFE